MDLLALQTLQDIIRVVMVLVVFYYIGLMCMLLSWLLNWSWKLAVKAGKTIWKLMKMILNRPEIAVTTVEKNEEM